MQSMTVEQAENTKVLRLGMCADIRLTKTYLASFCKLPELPLLTAP